MTLAEILEMIMLICFGFSWPITLMKNIRARTAKNMSLWFIVLILLGYFCGIAAKLIVHNYSFVLVVYAINVISVGANLVVYFINRGYDKKAV